MVDRRVAWLALGAALAAALAAAPRLAPTAPDTSPDPAAARDRPPGTTLHAIELAGGRIWLADDLRRLGDGGVVVSRRGLEHVLPAGAWQPATPEPRRRYLLGSDSLGRDLRSRLLHGLRNSLAVGLGAALLALAAGTLVGAVAGLAGGRTEVVVMRGVDLATAVPKLFVVLAVAAAVHPGPASLLGLLAAISWMPTARLVRAELRTLEVLDFGRAARAVGCSPTRILVRHHLPHLAGPLLVQTALATADLVLVEATLSFLGAGLPPPMASLGGMLAEATARPLATWWSLLFPGIALALPPLLLTAAAGAWDAPGAGAPQRLRSHRGAVAAG